MSNRIVLSGAVVALLAVGLPAINWAQEADLPFGGPQIQERHEKALRAQAEAMHLQAATAEMMAHKAAEIAKVKTLHKIFHGSSGHPRYLTEIREQAAKLRDADSETDKVTAMKNLTEVIDKCFEDDMKMREQELASIEERLSKLRAQLDRRRAKKQEIVDLQVKVAMNEAEGLGFYSEPKPGVFGFRGPDPFAVPMPIEREINVIMTAPPSSGAASSDMAPPIKEGPVPTPPMPPAQP